MKQKLRKVLGTALMVSMLGTMLGGSAFGAGNNDLFAGGKKPRLIVTDSTTGGYPEWVSEAREERYQSQTVKLATPANAVIASNSNALKASPSEVVLIDYDGDEGTLKLTSSKDQVINAGMEEGKMVPVSLAAADGSTTYEGEAEIKWNWFEYSFYDGLKSYDYERNGGYSKLSRNGLYVSGNKPVADVSISDLKFYTYPGDREITGVTLNTGGPANRLCLDWRGAKENGTDLDRTFERRIRIEMKDKGEVIGYCYVELPVYTKVNGSYVTSIRSWLATDPTIKDGELHITEGQISKDDWKDINDRADIKKLYISPSVTQFGYAPGDNAFKDNQTLEEVYFNYTDGTSRSTAPSQSADPIAIGKSMFEGCTALKKVSMPGVKNMTQVGVFKDCTSLKEVYAPDLQFTQRDVFLGCTALEEVNLPSLQTVDTGAFEGCTSLKKITLPGVYQINERAFKNCTSLKTLVLPESCPAFVNGSDYSATFENVTLPLEYIFVDRNGTELTGQAKERAQESYARSRIWSKVLDISDTSTVQNTISFHITLAGEQGKTAVSGSSIEACILPVLQSKGASLADVQTISGLRGKVSDEDWATLAGLAGLTSLEMGSSPSPIQTNSAAIPAVRMPKTLTSFSMYTIMSMTVPDSMFEGCAELEEVRMNRVMRIGSRAFANCKKLGTGKGFWLPDTPPVLGTDVFAGMEIKAGVLHTPYEELDNYRQAGGQWAAWVTGGSIAPTPTPAPGPQSSSSGRERASYGSWVQDAKGWKFTINNKNAAGQWAYLPYNSKFNWYYFDQNGYMATGWLTDAQGRTYYLYPLSDGTRGHMCTGWTQIDGKWYYFSEQEGSANGMLLKNTTTPDGHRVDENGVRIQ